MKPPRAATLYPGYFQIEPALVVLQNGPIIKCVVHIKLNETLLRRKCQGEMLLLATLQLNTEEPELVEAFLAGALLVLLTKLKLNQRITGFQRNSQLAGSV